MQKITIVGNLGQDLKSTPTAENGIIYDISVGCTQGKGDKKVTTWYRCSSNYINEGLKQYLTKGKKVLVHGTLKLSLYTNASAVTSINANVYIDYIELVGGASENNSDGQQSQQQAPAAPSNNFGRTAPVPPPPPDGFGGDKDDLPF